MTKNWKSCHSDGLCSVRFFKCGLYSWISFFPRLSQKESGAVYTQMRVIHGGIQYSTHFQPNQSDRWTIQSTYGKSPDQQADKLGLPHKWSLLDSKGIETWGTQWPMAPKSWTVTPLPQPHQPFKENAHSLNVKFSFWKSGPLTKTLVLFPAQTPPYVMRSSELKATLLTTILIWSYEISWASTLGILQYKYW